MTAPIRNLAALAAALEALGLLAPNATYEEFERALEVAEAEGRAQAEWAVAS